MKKLFAAVLLLWGLKAAAANVAFEAYTVGLPAAATITGANSFALSQSGAMVNSTATQWATFIATALGIPSSCTANFLFAAPNASSGALSCRALVANDVPLLTANQMPGFAGDVASSSGSLVTTIQPGAVSLAKMANLPATSFNANPSTSPGVPQAIDPLEACNLQQCIQGVTYAATANVATMSGAQSITLSSGSTFTANVGSLVLLTAQSTASQNGPWAVNSGAWTRPAIYKSGDVIANQCVVGFIDFTNGQIWMTSTTQGPSGTSITIDTTATAWQVRTSGATSVIAGVTKVTRATGPAVTTSAGGGTIPAGLLPCAAFSGAGISFVTIENEGNANQDVGFCVVSDNPSGHIILDDLGTQPTSSVGTVSAASSDEHGFISGLTAATSVTLTFANGWKLPNTSTAREADCTANNSTGTAVGVTPNSNGLTVVFSSAALTGSLSYHCL